MIYLGYTPMIYLGYTPMIYLGYTPMIYLGYTPMIYLGTVCHPKNTEKRFIDSIEWIVKCNKAFNKKSLVFICVFLCALCASVVNFISVVNFD